MNPFRDELPSIGRCPLCGHSGDGLQFAFPDADDGGIDLTRVQAACLSCGTHGDPRGNYADAIEAFRAGEWEQTA